MTPALQETLDPGAYRRAPEALDRPHRILVPVERLARFESAWQEIERKYADSSDVRFFCLRLRKAWDEFKGVRK